MKQRLSILLAAALGLTALADSPVYKSLTASGTTSAEVIFTADPVLQVRAVMAIGSSDKAASVFKFYGGGTPASVTYSNTAGTAATNLYVGGYGGFSTNDLVIISTGTTNRTMTVFGLANSTNIIVTAAIGFGVPINSDVFDLAAAPTQIACGAITNKAYSGEALFVAPRGRPLRVVLDGTSYSSLDTVTAHYDQ